jgi:hypothetical protein
LDLASQGSKQGGRDGQERRGSAATQPDSVVREEEERADRWGPHGSVMRERKQHERNAQTKGESIIW